MNTNSWIDMELSAVFGNWTLPETEPAIESGLSEHDEQAIMLELAKIERIVAARRAALSAQSAAKARSFRVLRHNRIAGV
jgi:hypothetical protein